MVSIQINFDNSINNILTELEKRTGNLTPVMQRTATMMQKDVFDHFKDEQGSSGAWKPLRPNTIKWKAKHGWTKPLQNTGRLRQSNYPSAGRDYAQILNDVDYAATHQFGTDKVPQRDFLWVSDGEMDKIGQMVLAYVGDAVNKK